jgi:hypothetical protein
MDEQTYIIDRFVFVRRPFPNMCHVPFCIIHALCVCGKKGLPRNE